MQPSVHHYVRIQRTHYLQQSYNSVDIPFMALFQRSKGLGFGSHSAGHVCKALVKLWIHTASVHPAVMRTWCTIQGWINNAGFIPVAEPCRGRERVGWTRMHGYETINLYLYLYCYDWTGDVPAVLLHTVRQLHGLHHHPDRHLCGEVPSHRPSDPQQEIPEYALPTLLLLCIVIIRWCTLLHVVVHFCTLLYVVVLVAHCCTLLYIVHCCTLLCIVTVGCCMLLYIVVAHWCTLFVVVR